MKKIFFKAAKRSAFVGWWSMISMILLIHFFYYGDFPSTET